MAQLKTLIVGGTGMLGHKLAWVASRAEGIEAHVTCRALPLAAFRAPAATYHDGISLGVSSTELGPLIRRLRPDVILNAAGAIKHRDITTDTASTLYLNGVLPHALAALNPNPNGRVIHFSTDCVFTGAKGAYRETDQPDSADLYGLSKASGELRYSPHLTIRTSIIGFELGNYLGLLEWFMRQPAGAKLKGYGRAIFSGLPTVTLAKTVLDVIRRPEITGLFHVASEPINKLELLQRIASALGLERTLVPSDDVVMDRSLDDSAFRRATNTVRPSWDELIPALVDDYHSMPYSCSEPGTHPTEAAT
jgi:dTDP-4-dehydrorhamnose reductase